MGLSIFAKRAFLNIHPDQDFEYLGTKPTQGYLKRVSSIIRADQIAEVTGAKLNPKRGSKTGISIYVKPELDQNGDFSYSGKSVYVDIIDEIGYANVLKKHPDLNALVLSERDYISLATEGISPDRIVLIPQHHCNFERIKRTRNKITTIGIIGNKRAFDFLPAELEKEFFKRNLTLLLFSEFFTRTDIVKFYQQIDIQLVWRPYKKKLANPLKIVNAASFGIPTIALEEIYFKEMGNCYIGVRDLKHLLIELDLLLTTPTRYQAYRDLCLSKAEEYHIEKIANLYRQLA